jgi:hypothetical protein
LEHYGRNKDQRRDNGQRQAGGGYFCADFQDGKVALKILRIA